MPRRKPYTEAGLRRVPCCRCGRPSAYQWRLACCADPSLPGYRGLCAEHDVELNAYVLRFFFGKAREAAIERYAAEVLS